MNTSLAHVNYLEGLFVREFRACQALLSITQEERSALSRDDISCLLSLTNQKEAILDEMASLEKAKFAALLDLRIISEPVAIAVLL